MEENPIQILEVRATQPSGSVMVTVAVGAKASQAIWIALSEQLDRRRQAPITSAEDFIELRDQIALVERFAPLASAGAHTIDQFSDAELRATLLDLTSYVDRVNGEHYQAPELRERLQTIAQITPVLWEANASAAAAGAEALAVPLD